MHTRCRNFFNFPRDFIYPSISLCVENKTLIALLFLEIFIFSVASHATLLARHHHHYHHYCDCEGVGWSACELSTAVRPSPTLESLKKN